MEPILATLEVVRVDEGTFDVLILSEDAVLKSFIKVYDNLFYIEESVFDNKPMVVAPSFPNQQHAMAWKEYWVKAFADPDNSCKTCATVQRLFQNIEAAREKAE